MLDEGFCRPLRAVARIRCRIDVNCDHFPIFLDPRAIAITVLEVRLGLVGLELVAQDEAAPVERRGYSAYSAVMPLRMSISAPLGSGV
jgi:hypothetical protein